MEDIDSVYEIVKKDIKEILSEKRYNHTIGVEQVAEELAIINNVDIKKAKLAAICHDIVKEFTPEQIEKFCTQNELDFSYLKEYKNIVHSHLGYYYAKIKYEIYDEDILNAIKYHTSGRANMSKLEKIIYLADFLDPNRNVEKYKENFEKARAYAFKDLDKAMAFVLERTLLYLKDSNIYEDTINAYEFYKVK